MKHVLQGMVTDTNGNPVPRIEVRHENCNCNSKPVSPVRTNASGTYSIGIQTFGSIVIPHNLNFYQNGNQVGNQVSPGNPPQDPDQPPQPPVVMPNSPGGGYRNSNMDIIIPAPEQPEQPEDPPQNSPDDEDEDEDEDEEQGNAGGNPNQTIAHHCGSKCRTKEGLCTRHTTSDGFCWQHRSAVV
ncbi:MAG: carboxypeptidase-like regulatory domain-containing protein [Thermodesulfovibrionia bacterium]|nr:carboxypeptidase-like regulatory domain-containing protein [Thermodesulfovibrionia bacterium]